MKQCCIDHNGKPKIKYSSKVEAENIVKLKAIEGIKLSIYQCKEGNGWHLTSHFIEHSESIANDKDISEFSDELLESYFLSKNNNTLNKENHNKIQQNANEKTKKYISDRNKLNVKLLNALNKKKQQE